MNLKQKAISGAKWTTVSTICTAVIQVLRLSILTRFLDKNDFGIVAILTFVLGLTNTFANLGFSASIMHKQSISNKEFSSLFWIQFCFFLFLYVIASILSPFISDFYNESSITYLMPIVLLDLIFNGFGRLYDTVLQRDMLFKTIAIRNIVSSILSIFVALVLAALGYGIYSMILSTLFQTALFNIWNFVYGQKIVKIKFQISFHECLPLVKIGIYQTGTQILDYFSSKFDVLIIGKLLGTETLGLYNLAKELVMKVIILINSIANKIILPVLAKDSDNNEILKERYLFIIDLLSRINFPISSIFFVFSTPIVYILYGPKFDEVSIFVQILSFWSLLLCIGNPIGSVAIAKGKTDLSFLYTIIRVLLTIPVIYFASLINIKLVAWSNVILELILFIIAWRMLLNKMIGLKMSEYINSFKTQVILAFIISAPFTLIYRSSFSSIFSNKIFDFVFYLFIFSIVYCAAYLKIYGIDFFKNILKR